MTSAQSLRELNAELERHGASACWYETRYRIYPARQIRLPLVRSSHAEQEARAFFAEVSHDPELLCRRAGILLQWARGRTSR